MVLIIQCLSILPVNMMEVILELDLMKLFHGVRSKKMLSQSK